MELASDYSYPADFAHPWSNFNKVIEFEFTVTKTGEFSSTLEEKGIVDMYNTCKTYLEPYKEFLTVLMDTSYPGVHFYTAKGINIVKAELHKINNEGEIIISNVSTNAINNHPHEFATGEWLIRNLRFPTYSNLQYGAINAEELPIPGEIYTQFTFQYAVPRRGLSGMGAVGQQMMSVTTHTFYVKGDVTAYGEYNPAQHFKACVDSLFASPSAATELDGPAAFNPEEGTPAYNPEEGNENLPATEE